MDAGVRQVVPRICFSQMLRKKVLKQPFLSSSSFFLNLRQREVYIGGVSVLTNPLKQSISISQIILSFSVLFEIPFI